MVYTSGSWQKHAVHFRSRPTGSYKRCLGTEDIPVHEMRLSKVVKYPTHRFQGNATMQWHCMGPREWFCGPVLSCGPSVPSLSCDTPLLRCVCARESPSAREHPAHINLKCRSYHGHQVIWIQTGCMLAGKYERLPPFYYNIELATTKKTSVFNQNIRRINIHSPFSWHSSECKPHVCSIWNMQLQAVNIMNHVCSQKENSLETEISITNINKILSFLDDLYGLKLFANVGILLTVTKGRTVAKTIKLRFYKGFPPSLEVSWQTCNFGTLI